MSTVRWGILGPGTIAREFFRSAAACASGAVVAVASRSPDHERLGRAFPGARVFDDYEELLADPGIDAIYIATPHPFHARWAIAAAAQGKHVLSEKPMAMNGAEARAMVAAAHANDTFLAEAYMYRHHPLTTFLLDLVRGGTIGDVVLIKSSFGFAHPTGGADHRLFAKDLGGGAILDVGGYPVTMACLIAGYREADRALQPVSLSAEGLIGPTGVDEVSSALLRFANGIVAQVSCSIALVQDNVLSIIGTRGRLEVDDFWFGTGVTGGTKIVRHVANDGTIEELPLTEPRDLYSFQFDACNAAITAGRRELSYPQLDLASSIATADILDQWLAAVHGTAAT
ncbi:Gfo/Idh/MocA family oxidoreductase [Novosphingobium sp. SG720]|uniref:Gfo/Idh/MocA family protein n=1 Tax=Novosphingobium sp. SG720 TaxID=2586998 RepID=UPI001445447E|nr:Gfo/Idh/MocA family oxidoreductase [Novosphingobium sp. SG720]NKJ42302.1 putative dehydrogenase [Novosphingobium sp. SG720]